jgi:hypothetical protein
MILLQFHKISDIFPLMRSDESETLKKGYRDAWTARTDLSVRG